MPEIDRRAAFRVLAKFVLIFLLATALHFFVRPVTVPFINETLNASVAARLLNAIVPAEVVQPIGSSISSDRATVQVALGCDGVDVALMVTAAVAAFPMTKRRKLLGILAGIALIYACNLARIMTLWGVLRFFPAAFESMHVAVGQTIIIVVGVLFVGFWTGAFTAALRPKAVNP